MSRCALILSLCSIASVGFSQELEILKTESGLSLSWPRSFPEGSGVASELETSIMCLEGAGSWKKLATVTGAAGDGAGSYLIDPTLRSGVFFIEESVKYAHRADAGAQPALYNEQLADARVRIPAKSLQKGGVSVSVSDLSWDPTTAAFYTEYMTTPQDHNASLAADDPERRVSDFTLNAQEQAMFRQNGFVVSPNAASAYEVNGDGGPISLPTRKPVDLYYQVWADDLPVFVTADSVLDAWHQTFSRILRDTEELYLYPMMREMLTNAAFVDLTDLHTEWSGASAVGAADVVQAIEHLDLYLGVATRLVTSGGTVGDALHADETNKWRHLVLTALEGLLEPGLYGDDFRLEDVSFFKPRAHYTSTEVLTAHFRTLMWLSRAQFEIGDGSKSLDQAMEELRAAALLVIRLEAADEMGSWQMLENSMSQIAGQSDTMSVPELGRLLQQVGISTVADLGDGSKMMALRAAILDSTYGIQEIDPGNREPGGSCVSLDPASLPRAMSLFGQRWSPDAWTLQQVVPPYLQDEEGQTLYRRRYVSSIDAMYAALGSEAAGAVLSTRMADADGVALRDGIPFEGTAQRTRAVLDGQSEEFWTETVYNRWLYSLRALSAPLPSHTPETFRTAAWGDRMLNTQLASWTQLRHDTNLLVKQSNTPPLVCFYPDGYVDPYPEFWTRLAATVRWYRSSIAQLDGTGTFRVEPDRDEFSFNDLSAELRDSWSVSEGYSSSVSSAPLTIDRAAHKALLLSHLDRFAVKCDELAAIATEQVGDRQLTAEQKHLLETVVEDVELVGYGGERRYSGWFPNLYLISPLDPEEDEFYEHPSAKFEPVATDIHTVQGDARCTGDAGGVVHNALGRAQFMMVAVKHRDGTSCVYGGPVMQHYEFTEGPGVRVTNEQWLQRIQSGNLPAMEPWKASFQSAGE